MEPEAKERFDWKTNCGPRDGLAFGHIGHVPCPAGTYSLVS